MAAERPNVLVIFTDDQCYRSIGYNNDQVKTPYLDRLAGEGMVMENAYVASPICAASRASMMTGLYPQQHGVIALNTKPFEVFRKEGEKAGLTLGHCMGEAGYHCAFFGKSHLGDPKTYGFHEGRESKDVRDLDTFADATSFLDKAAGMNQPFFLWLAPRQPHVPLLPEQKWLDLYDEKAIKLDPNFREQPIKDSINNQGKPGEHFYRDSDYTRNWKKLPAGPPRDEESMKQFIKAYYATISHLDHQVGTLIGRLDQLGLSEKTLIIFLSDNGYHLGNHGLGNKITMHEESVRVPMWMRWKGTIEPGQMSEALVSSLDVYPTLLAVAGAQNPHEESDRMGQSLVPLMKNPRAPYREAVFSECTGVGGKLGDGHRMVRWMNFKMIRTDQHELRFFDLSRDKYESGAVAEGESKKNQAELIKKLTYWQRRIGDQSLVK